MSLILNTGLWMPPPAAALAAYDTYGLAASPGSSTVTLGGVGTFAPIDNETTAICLYSGLGAGESVTGLTIGGRAASRTDEYTGAGAQSEHSIWIPDTNGTFSTTDVVITHSATPFRTVVAAFNLGNLTRSNGANSGAANPGDVSANTVSGDVLVAIGFVNDAGYTPGDAVGVGFSERSLDINVEGNRSIACFLQTSATGGTPETLTMDAGTMDMDANVLTVFN